MRVGGERQVAAGLIRKMEAGVDMGKEVDRRESPRAPSGWKENGLF